MTTVTAVFALAAPAAAAAPANAGSSTTNAASFDAALSRALSGAGRTSPRPTSSSFDDSAAASGRHQAAPPTRAVLAERSPTGSASAPNAERPPANDGSPVAPAGPPSAASLGGPAPIGRIIVAAFGPVASSRDSAAVTGIAGTPSTGPTDAAGGAGDVELVPGPDDVKHGVDEASLQVVSGALAAFLAIFLAMASQVQASANGADPSATSDAPDFSGSIDGLASAAMVGPEPTIELIAFAEAGASAGSTAGDPTDELHDLEAFLGALSGETTQAGQGQPAQGAAESRVQMLFDDLLRADAAAVETASTAPPISATAGETPRVDLARIAATMASELSATATVLTPTPSTTLPADSLFRAVVAARQVAAVAEAAQKLGVGAIEGSFSVAVQLHPRDLGTVAVQIDRTSAGINARIETSGEAGRAAVAANLDAIRAALNAAGIAVADIALVGPHGDSAAMPAALPGSAAASLETLADGTAPDRGVPSAAGPASTPSSADQMGNANPSPATGSTAAPSDAGASGIARRTTPAPVSQPPMPPIATTSTTPVSQVPADTTSRAPVSQAAAQPIDTTSSRSAAATATAATGSETIASGPAVVLASPVESATAGSGAAAAASSPTAADDDAGSTPSAGTTGTRAGQAAHPTDARAEQAPRLTGALTSNTLRANDPSPGAGVSTATAQATRDVSPSDTVARNPGNPNTSTDRANAAGEPGGAPTLAQAGPRAVAGDPASGRAGARVGTVAASTEAVQAQTDDVPTSEVTPTAPRDGSVGTTASAAPPATEDDAARAAAPAAASRPRTNHDEASLAAVAAPNLTAAPRTEALTASAAPAPSSEAALQLVRDIADQIGLLANQGKSELQLQLRPENLGRLAVRMTVENGAVTVHMNAETSQARTVLESNLGQLRQALHDQGIRVDRMVIDIAQSQLANDQQHPRRSRGLLDDAPPPRRTSRDDEFAKLLTLSDVAAQPVDYRA